MTPKEKAYELTERIRKAQGSSKLYPVDKQTAIICVDEILKIFEGLHKPEYCAFDAIGERKFNFESVSPEYMNGYDMEAYFNEVKKEIEKL